LKLSDATAALGVVLGAVVIVAFLILGSELLAPEGHVPGGNDVASDLAVLLEDVWGSFGYWALIITFVFALGGSVIANQDGWSRSFADITRLLALEARPAFRERQARHLAPERLRRLFGITVGGLLPAAVIVVVGNPVTIMAASGVVAAVHTPFIVVLILLVNSRSLPRSLRPGRASIAGLVAAGLFYGTFAVTRFIV
jgi:Mn2+/Fe2+ NRAMP family transporter